MVHTRRGDCPPVRRERDGPYGMRPACIREGLAQRSPGGEVVEVDSLAPGPGDEQLAVGGEGHGVNFPWEAPQGAKLPSGRRLPQTHRLRRRRGEEPAVGREGEPPYRVA